MWVGGWIGGGRPGPIPRALLEREGEGGGGLCDIPSGKEPPPPPPAEMKLKAKPLAAPPPPPPPRRRWIR